MLRAVVIVDEPYIRRVVQDCVSLSNELPQIDPRELIRRELQDRLWFYVKVVLFVEDDDGA